MVNQKHLVEITISRNVAKAALDLANTQALADVEMDPTLPGKINGLADKIETGIGKMTGTRVDKKVMTAQEKAARDALLGVIAPIQTAAKRKFTGDTAKQRETYYIGANLANEDLEEVITASRAILTRLSPGPNNAPPEDLLPGIKPNKEIQALADAITLYGGKDAAQGEEKKKASKENELIEADIKTLAGYRREVQLAADQAWPWRTAGVAAIRKQFLLAPDRPLKG